jgi:capsular exopolysaccharide synthesis family protein
MVRSNFSEAYYALRTSLRLLSSRGLTPSLVVTSGREAEGKSTTSYALARSFAQIGVRTLLIDGDLRRPSLHHSLGEQSDTGFSALLARQATLAQAVQDTEVSNLSFVPSGLLPPNPTELLSGTTLGEVIREAKERFDLVLIDGPPVLGLADAVLYSDAVDGTLFVVEAGGPRASQGRQAVRRLVNSGAKMLGVVLTKFDPRHTGYGDEYGYYYRYGGTDTAKR